MHVENNISGASSFLSQFRHFHSLVQSIAATLLVSHITRFPFVISFSRSNISQLNSKTFACSDKRRPLLQNFPPINLAIWPSQHPLFAIIQSIRHHQSITLATQPVALLEASSHLLCFGRNPCSNVGRPDVTKSGQAGQRPHLEFGLLE